MDFGFDASSVQGDELQQLSLLSPFTVSRKIKIRQRGENSELFLNVRTLSMSRTMAYDNLFLENKLIADQGFNYFEYLFRYLLNDIKRRCKWTIERFNRWKVNRTFRTAVFPFGNNSYVSAVKRRKCTSLHRN